MMAMSVLDLFSGIGGFSLGLERAGMQTVAFCEIDPWCRRVLAKHWPDVPIFEDVKKLRGADVGPVDLICGGFPCQPFSLAGQRGGAEDDRHLWPEMLRIISEIRPSWVIGENVAGLSSMGINRRNPYMESQTLTRTTDRDDYHSVLSLQEDMLLNEICMDFEKAGYEAQPLVIPAVGLDAPHQRDRIWIIAHAYIGQREGTLETICTRRHTIDPGSAIAANTNSARQCAGEGQSGPSEARHNIGRVCAAVSHTSSAGHGAGRFNPRWREWPVEPGMGRVAHGVPNRVDRIRGLGNAVVPHIPEIIGRAILAVEAEVRAAA